MFCTNCGTQNNDASKFCTGCGKTLLPASPTQFSSLPSSQTTNQVNDEKLEIGMWVLILLFPLIGIILFFVWMKEKPKKSKQSLLAAGISFFITIVITLFSLLLVMMISQ